MEGVDVRSVLMTKRRHDWDHHWGSLACSLALGTSLLEMGFWNLEASSEHDKAKVTDDLRNCLVDDLLVMRNLPQVYPG